MASRKSLSALAASLMADFSSSIAKAEACAPSCCPPAPSAIANTPDVLLNGTRAAASSFAVSLSDAREE